MTATTDRGADDSPRFMAAGAASSAAAAALPQLGTFDYVIVGGGPSAMGLVYGLLTNNNSNNDKEGTASTTSTIALLERGHGAAHPTTHSLHRWCAASHQPDSRSNRLYPGRHGAHRLLDVPTGVGLGGSTLINAGLVVPPAASDFDEWPIDRTVILRSVDAVIQAMHDHGCVTPSTTAALEMPPFQNSGLPVVDPTRPWKALTVPSRCLHVPCGAARADGGGSAVQRQNYYQSLVEPLLSDPALAARLTVYTGYAAERLLFSSSPSPSPHTCSGVEAQSAVTGVRHEIVASTAVILCAGTFVSPALLLAAGVGHRADCAAIGVSVRSDATAAAHVGGHLRDHVLVPRILLTSPSWASSPPSLNGVRAVANLVLPPANSNNSSSNNKGDEMETRAQISLMDSAAYTDLVPLMVAAAVRFRVDVETASIPSSLVPAANLMLHWLFLSVQFLFYVLVAYTPVYYLLRYCVAVVAVFLMNAASEGAVRVRRTSPGGPDCRLGDLELVVDLGYLRSEGDVTRLGYAYEASRAVYPAVGIEVFPGPLVRTLGLPPPQRLHPGRFAAFCHAMARPYFHWLGTCAMRKRAGRGSDADDDGGDDDDDDDWVVDADFCVRGVTALRVCDASVFPTLISAPTAVTCAALGHVLAAKLRAGEASKRDGRAGTTAHLDPETNQE